MTTACVSERLHERSNERQSAPPSERAVIFGSHRGLVGVLTEPIGRDASDDGTPPRRAVVLSNVGTNHRVGPYRLWVDLARELAADGWYVLRFDQAGLGDSAPRSDALPDDGTRDVAEAVEWLAESAGIEEFVLAGLCSGVDAAHRVAVTDPRVVAAIFIDGYTYPTPGWRWRRLTTRYLQGGRWLAYARRHLRRAFTGSRSRAEVAAIGPQVFDRAYPPVDDFRADVARLTARGARLLFVFTGTVDVHYNGDAQLFETLGPATPRDRIVVDRCPAADHVFSSVAERRALIGRIGRWLSRAVGDG